MNILYFVFSWKGQYENAKEWEMKLLPYGKVVVINSDDDNEEIGWVNIGNECYFSDQFKKALEIYQENTDIDAICHIQADASFDDFGKIIESAKITFGEYHWGVYAPHVDDTFYTSDRTDVFDLKDGLAVVATTDNTCWFIHKDMINTMIENIHLMEGNHLGWGWDLLICSFAHLKERKVIRDYNFIIDHPASTGYMKDQAEQEMQDMFIKCGNDLKEVIYYIKMQPKTLTKYYNIKNDVIVYDTSRGLL
jgi:hypothetical protein